MSPIRAVVFDLDGTLVDSMPLVLRAFAYALQPFRPDLDEAAIFHRLGGPPARALLDLIGDEAKAEQAMQRLQAFGFEDGKLVEPFSGMRNLVTRLKDQGYLLALWTGRDRKTTEMIISAHGLESYFPVVVCGDDLTTHKPNPAGMVAVLDKLGVRPDEALYIGDADADVLGGTYAGVRTVLIRHGRQPDHDIVSRAWHVVDTPTEVFNWIYALVSSQWCR